MRQFACDFTFVGDGYIDDEVAVAEYGIFGSGRITAPTARSRGARLEEESE